MGGQLGIEYQFTGKCSGTFFPEFDKTKDLIVLVGFSNLGIGVAKHPLLGILSQESEDSLLLSTAFGNVVFSTRASSPWKGMVWKSKSKEQPRPRPRLPWHQTKD